MFYAGEFQTFALGLMYAFLFTPASFLCWYRPAYKAFKTDSSLDFMVFFFIFFCQMVVTVIQTIGIPGTGTCGFIMALSHFGKDAGGVVVGIFLLLIACGFGTCAAGDVMMLTKVKFNLLRWNSYMFNLNFFSHHFRSMRFIEAQTLVWRRRENSLVTGLWPMSMSKRVWQVQRVPWSTLRLIATPLIMATVIDKKRQPRFCWASRINKNCGW